MLLYYCHDDDDDYDDGCTTMITMIINFPSTGDSIIEPVRSSHIKQCINALVSSIVAAVRKTLPHAWSLFGLDLFFKMSANDGAILFM